MTITTVPTLEASGFDPQNLFVIGTTDSWREGVPGVPFYQSIGQYSFVLFPTTNTETGTSITIDGDGKVITLVDDGVYEITVSVSGVTPDVNAGFVFFVNNATNAVISPAINIGTPMTFLIENTSGDPLPIKCIVAASDPLKSTTPWHYPQQIFNTNVVVKMVSGFTV